MSNSKTCSIEGCERPHRARGMCTTHRYRFDNGLPMEVEVRQYEHEPVCKVEGCENPRGNGSDGTYCAMHKRRVDRHGEVGGVERQRAPFGEPVWSEPNIRRGKNLFTNYGITVEQYDALLLRQNYLCAICGTDRPANARGRAIRAFCVDHDHETGKVRGLLCQGCNRGLGLLKDDLTIVEAALRYLRHHQPSSE